MLRGGFLLLRGGFPRVPITVCPILGATYFLYELGFYVFHWKASLPSILSILGSAFAFLIALYTSRRIFQYAATFHTEAMTPPEGVWPPPPTQKDRTIF